MKIPPQEYRIFRFGTNKYQYGDGPIHEVLVDEEAMKTVAAFSDFSGITPVDYGHKTLTGEEMQASGWLKKWVNKGADGLWAIVQWTDAALEWMAARKTENKTCYFSPYIIFDKNTKRLLAIPNLALTDQPATIDAAAILADAGSNISPDSSDCFEARIDISALSQNQTNGAHPPSGAEDTRKGAYAPKKQKEEKSMKKILELLGLKPEASEDEACAALSALKTKAEKPPEKDGLATAALSAVYKELGLKEHEGQPEAIGTILALKARPGDETVKRIAALELEIAGRKKDDLVAAALSQGKITPDQKAWAEETALKDPKCFEAFLAKAPRVVPVGAALNNPGKPPAGSGADGDLTESQKKINRQMGISDETWKKHGPHAHA